VIKETAAICAFVGLTIPVCRADILISISGTSVIGMTNPTGVPNGQGWISNGSDWVFDAFLYNANGHLINDPATGFIWYALTPGTHSFTIRGDLGDATGLAWSFAALTLNFDTPEPLSMSPQIAGVSVPVADFGHTLAPLVATGTVFSLDRSYVPAPGSIIYSRADGASVTLTSFAWRETIPGNGDLVSPQSPTPNGVPDYLGEFTLVVIPAPPAALVFGSFAAWVSRRRRPESC
jgi:hypothetical protein